MNKYQQSIHNVESNHKIIWSKMRRLSGRLAEAMEFDVDAIRAAEMDSVTWDVGKYTIGARGFPWNEWKPMLIAVPQGIDPHRLGYRGHSPSLPPEWHFYEGGTATEILPPEDIWADIIEAVKQGR